MSFTSHSIMNMTMHRISSIIMRIHQTTQQWLAIELSDNIHKNRHFHASRVLVAFSQQCLDYLSDNHLVKCAQA